MQYCWEEELKLGMKKFWEGSPFIALAVFIMCITGALLYVSGLGEFGANLFISSITAIATGMAAWMAAKSAGAARKAADQWKEQKHYERELDAIIDVLTSFSQWRNNLIQLRQGVGAPIVERFTPKQSPFMARYASLDGIDIPEALQKHLEASNRLRTAIDRARVLGIYEHEASVDVYKLDYQFTQALQRFRHLQLRGEQIQLTDRKHLDVISDTARFDEYGNALNGSWMNFETRYKSQLRNSR